MRLSDFQNRMACEGRWSITARALECVAFLWRRLNLNDSAGLILRYDFQCVLICIAGVPYIAKQRIVTAYVDFSARVPLGGSPIFYPPCGWGKRRK